MNIVNILHNKAMDFADEAEITTHKGDKRDAISLYLKAFLLEKEAAMNTPLDYEDKLPRHILIRSAASLAMLSEQFEEAEKLILLGLTSMPPVFIEEELKTLAQEVKQKKRMRKEEHAIHLVGLFTYVNASLNEIKYRVN
ncbi:MAG: hypothetical protein AAF849_03755 [Bacteroidota bacterium]